MCCALPCVSPFSSPLFLAGRCCHSPLPPPPRLPQACWGGGARCTPTYLSIMTTRNKQWNWHGFILWCTQSTTNSPTWYKTYAIVGSVSIPTYKQCYAGAIFEFSENNGASQKKFFTMSESFVILVSENGVFFCDRTSSTSLLFLKKKWVPRAPIGLRSRVNKQKTTS